MASLSVPRIGVLSLKEEDTSGKNPKELLP